MVYYSVQPRDRIFEKDYRFLSFSKNMDKIICKIISENLNGKYNQKRFVHVKKSDAFKIVSKRAIQKYQKKNGDLIGNNIAKKIMTFLRSLTQNNSKLRMIKKIPKE